MLSGLFLAASWATEIKIWQRILHLVGGELSYGVAVQIWFLSAITRYIPGNIWQPLSMTMRCQREGIRPESTIASVLLFQMVILTAAGPVAALYFGWSSNYGAFSNALAGWTVWLIVIILLPVLLFIAKPKWFFTLVNWGLQKIGRAPLNLAISSWQLIVLIAIAIFHWGLWGCSFAALTLGLNPYPVSEMLTLMPHLIASFAIAYTIGFVSFITPSGFGVREGAFVLLLAPFMGRGAATVAAIAMRLWSTVGEVLFALICLLSERSNDKKIEIVKGARPVISRSTRNDKNNRLRATDCT